jgi:SNF2 family DNA or RNA helicase
MITAELGDLAKVVLSGSGLELMRVRSLLAKYLKEEEALDSGGGLISVTLRAFLAIPSEEFDGIECSDSLLETVQQERESIDRHLDAVANIPLILSSEVPIDREVQLSETLKPYQAAAVLAITQRGLRGACLFDEQGTGKTLMAISAFATIRNDGLVDAAVIVAPKTLLSVWKQEFETFTGSQFTVVDVAGSPQERLNLIYTSADVHLITYESNVSDLILTKSLFETRNTMLIVDESHLAKNAVANRTQALFTLRSYAARALVLCGTPAPNHAIDLVSQFNLADGGIAFQGFKSKKGEEGLFDQIADRIESRGPLIRRTKDEVLNDLADKRFEIVPCDMTARQQELYDHAKRELVMYLKRLDDSTFKRSLATYFQKRAALLQISISPALIGDWEFASGKYEKLEEIVEQKLAEHDTSKLIIWSSYTKSIDHVASLVSRWNPVVLDGRAGDAKNRQAIVQTFQEDSECRILIGNPAAAGAGITLTAASTAIYLNAPTQAAQYMQSIDRNHRIGQTANVVEYIMLVSKGTLDLADTQRLAAKQQNQSALLNDVESVNWQLNDAISELQK